MFPATVLVLRSSQDPRSASLRAGSPLRGARESERGTQPPAPVGVTKRARLLGTLIG